VIGVVFASFLFAAALWRRDSMLGKLALGFSVALAAVALAVYFTGEPAEEAVEHLAGVSQAAIERHEDAALVSTIAMSAFGVLALGATVWFRRRALPTWVVAGGLVGALGLVGFMGWTANLGGRIRHTEIRAGALAAPAGAERGDGAATATESEREP
jgi:hypothetical protein